MRTGYRCAMEKHNPTVRAALAGNPNVGKSTVFNGLTGLHQHTGNWPGKTVAAAEGTFTYRGTAVSLTDLPGIYSLAARSAEEDAAREFLETRPDVTVVVCDASSLERNLILWGQIRAMGLNVILCVNLMDEAEKRGITVDGYALKQAAGCPVVFTSARSGRGLEDLRRAIVEYGTVGNTTDPLHGTPSAAFLPHSGGKSPEMGGHGWDFPPECCENGNCGEKCPENGGKCISRLVREAEEIAKLCTKSSTDTGDTMESRLDRLFCGRFTAFPIMLLFTGLLLWLTLEVSGILSDGLAVLSGWILEGAGSLLGHIPLPWLVSLIRDGLLATVLQVISVMLPPMAIFFPLFTLLEDLGYLPRIAFNLDRCFACAGSCGKQSLTMLMGLGCNAAAVTGCRIIDSPRERIIAVLTNAFIPCNGRLPILFAMLAMLGYSSGVSMLFLTGLLILSVTVTLLVSKLLSATILRGEVSSFTLELPPYRIPQIGRTLVRSLLDRCLFVLGRAVTAAAPAGILIWLTVHWEIGGIPLYTRLTGLFDPIGKLAAMDGVLMLSFLLALPAAELMLPLASAGYTLTLGGVPEFAPATCMAVILFTVFHFPCATTLLTIRHEYRNDPRGSLYVLLAALIPTVIGYGMCVLVNTAWS